MPLKTPLMEKVLKKKSYEWGAAEEKKKTARSMLADGMAPELISKFTELSEREIEDLRHQS
ncbi:MAG: hypothetical protein LBP21_05100 [Synergistaceae bacterium]|jgi:hypothetical protein|nr:hypothetical protein [Synergistaceae bacterium]